MKGTRQIMRWNLAIAAGLIVGTLLVFWPVREFDFITLDDPAYVAKNSKVSAGLTHEGVRWAFTSYHGGNWHPVTWLSHMLDCQWFGLKPGAHHVVNVVLHALTAAGLFLLLGRMTDRRWPSVLVAAVFAWHPQRVESVAWIAERKDVLSGLFFVLVLWAYAEYVRRQRANRPRGGWFYAAALVLFALGLMSKPMLVSVPVVLLLIDYWPLKRWSADAAEPNAPVRWRRLILEKLPFILLSAVFCGITVIAQHNAGALKDVTRYPMGQRLVNATVSVERYLRDLFWPARLNYFYPFEEFSALEVGFATGVILVITALAIWQLKRRPFLVVGWLWFIVMLIPVIGLVQVGTQARADRYSYLPSIGFLLAVIWRLSEAGWPWRHWRWTAPSLALAALTTCVAVTRSQLVHWRDGITICRRSIQIEPRDARSHYNLACSMDAKGDKQAALAHFREAVRISPDYEKAHNNLGVALAESGDLRAAEPHFREVVRLNPKHLGAQRNLATMLTRQGRFAEAIPHFEALRKPDRPDPQLEQIITELKARAQLSPVPTHQGDPAKAPTPGRP